ncbi:hypothetical protein [Providencia alcalifaciens]|uniref:hypothetical protein n=1 Tax=Providencia alcalifaciens TaxID=126385 RepID=UPI000D3395E0|nr:hypothetical protein [Providencia alcalifaciens]
MKNPKLIVKPFAKNGQKNVIPENYETSMDSNQATWDQGFGQITMLPVAAGGLPPKGQDFNGILNQISENIVYQSQGGRFKFSPEYAESIGGYPKGAILQSDDEKKEYQSLIDNNKVNFNTTSNISASWELVGSKYAIKAEVDLALLKKFDKENISGILGNDQSKVPSLGLLTTEVGKLATKGELSTGLASKQPVGDYATNIALATGLSQKLNTSSVVQSTGSSTTQVMSQDSVTKTFVKIGDYGVGEPGAQIEISDKKFNGFFNADKFSPSIPSDTFFGISSYSPSKLYGLLIAGRKKEIIARTIENGVPSDYSFYHSGNATADKNGFLRTSQQTSLITSDIAQSTGSSTTQVMSQKAVTDALSNTVIGIGQSWTDVSSSRSSGLTYTNSSSKAISIVISGQTTASKQGVKQVEVDGKVIMLGNISTQSQPEGYSLSVGPIIIPAGSSYKITFTLNSFIWYELK